MQGEAELDVGDEIDIADDDIVRRRDISADNRPAVRLNCVAVERPAAGGAYAAAVEGGSQAAEIADA
jgi:hypothetical protein